MKSLKSLTRQQEQQRRATKDVAIIACMVLFLCIFSLIKARYLSPNTNGDAVQSHVSMKLEVDNSVVTAANDEDEDADGEAVNPMNRQFCYESSKRSDTCDMEGRIRFISSNNTILVHSSASPKSQKIKPYPRKNDNVALANVKEWSLTPVTDQNRLPQCNKRHRAPAVVFSTGGFCGNLFHDFTDVLIPLFISSRQFNGDVQFIVTDYKNWWIEKYSNIFSQLSKYDVINADEDDEDLVRCFPRVIIGPIFHKELGVDASKSIRNHSILDFKAMLRSSFGLQRQVVAPMKDSQGYIRRPRLLILSRKNSRAFVNRRMMVSMAMSLGFEVRIGEPDINTDVIKFAKLVNTADVMIAVHGAGLTNMLFLPEGAVLIQVIPLGGLEWIARDSFKQPAIEMKVNYMEYRIDANESTLLEQYPKDHPVIKNPFVIHKQGWDALKSIYLDKQNVKPNLGKLMKTFKQALSLLPQGT